MSAETNARFFRLAYAAALLLASAPADAVTFSLQGYAGTQSSPEQEVPPTAVGPIALDIPNTLGAPRSATAYGFVDHGVVQVRARVEAPAGTPSIGDLVATMTGSWTDSITFTTEGLSLPPGVEVIPGVTPGTADLVIDIDGDFFNLFGGSISRSSYFATLTSGILESYVEGSFDAPFSSGTPTPTSLTLNVPITYDVPFDFSFQLTVNAEIGWEGNADADYVAAASFDHTALWGGAQNVRALVPDGLGGTTSVALPDGSWSLNSPSFDYTEPVVIPEPGSLALLLLGLTVLAVRRRRG